jgi:hypothetical protein
MAHFSKVVNGKVIDIIVADEDFFETFVDDSPGQWIQTSYNTRGGVHYDPETGEPSADQSKAFRKNYGGVDYTYDSDLDAFIPPKPYSSWVLNEDTCLWEPPIEKPDEENYYVWDEENTTWKVV